MIKARAAVSAAVLAALALTGCGGNSAAGTNVEQDANAPLDIWVRFAPDSPAEATAKALAAKFTEKTGIKATVTASTDLETKLQQAAASKDLPDIVVNDVAQLGNLVSQGLVQEVDKSEIAGSDKLSTTAWQAATASDGKQYGVPFNAQTYAILIRKDWREKVGLPEPKSWDDLVALGKAFTTGDPDGNGKADTYGFNVPGTTTRGYISWYFTNFLFSDGADYLTGSGGKFTPAIASDNSVAALTWFQGLFCTEKVVMPGSITQSTGDAIAAFQAGKAGIYLTGPYNLASADKVGAGKVEAVPVPAGPNGGGKAGALAEGENIYLMAGSPNQAGQKKFAEFATSVEGQTIAMAGDQEGSLVRLPVNQDVKMSEVRTDTRWQVFADVYANGGKLVPAVPNWTPFRQASADTFNAIVANCSSDPKAELTKLNDTFKQELQKQGVLG